jgi:hypothetical protein
MMPLKHNPYIPLFHLTNTFQGLAFFLPPTFLPSYLLSLHPTHGFVKSSLLLCLNSVSQACGQIAMGHISDCASIHVPPAISTLVTGITAFGLWGAVTGKGNGLGFASLCVFAMLWGFFATSYSVLWTKIARGLATSHHSSQHSSTTQHYCSLPSDLEGETRNVMGWDEGGDVDEAQALHLYALFSLERGIAAGLVGPLSALLLSSFNGEEREAVIGEYGLHKYKGVIIFTGTCLLLSSLGGLAWFFDQVNGRKRVVKLVK